MNFYKRLPYISVNKLIKYGLIALLGFMVAIKPSIAAADSHPDSWRYAWPDTDFSRHDVPYSDILSGGPPKDGIPSIDDPIFATISEVENNETLMGNSKLEDSEPVIGLIIEGVAKAYPLRILTWHEIVNDEIAGIPITVTFCPLCNSAIVFDRRLDGRVFDFGTTGKLRNSDLVMYDRQTQSWWQQFMGTAIIGELTGATLHFMPSRIESWQSFKSRAPNGLVLVPNDSSMRNYGRNPYVGYDSAAMPFLYNGEMPENINPMVRVIAVDDQAWSLDLLQSQGSISSNDILIQWRLGQNSVLDTGMISKGRDVGNVTVQRLTTDGSYVDIVHDITFAFVFHAFRPEGVIHQ